MNEQTIFRLIRIIADNCFDGHFTLLKFTTNYRLCFGTPVLTRQGIEEMPADASLLGVFVKALEAADFPSKPQRPISET